jgi:hypothetical protein
LTALALPADMVPNASVASTVPSGGSPPAARNMTGSVVISNSSMTRGLVSATNARMVAASLRPGCATPAACRAATDAATGAPSLFPSTVTTRPDALRRS